MSRILIIGILAFSFLQLAVGQDACTNALSTLARNAQRCTATVENPRVICTGECRGYYDDIINNCAPAQAAAQQEAFNTVCGNSSGGAGVIKGLGVYSLMLLSVIAAVVF